MRDPWNDLLEFETRDLVKEYFKGVHNSEVNVWKISEVTSNFIQAREYFRNAQESNITVKPLLLYYGVLAMSKGLILTLDPKKTETTLRSSHGIEVKDWSQILKTKEFEKLELTVGEGSFSELLDATGNTNYLRAGSKGINWKSQLSRPDKGYKFKLEQLYYYLPDLFEEFKTWTSKELPFIVIDELRYDNSNNLGVAVLSGTYHNKELIDLVFPEKYCKDLEIEKGSGKTIVKWKYSEIEWSPNITQKWSGPFDLGVSCVIPVLTNDKGLNIVSTMFTLAYVYGMMARYFPTTWISLGRVRQGDKIYPLIHRTLDFIVEKFPIVTIDFLRAPYNFENNGE